MVCNSDIVIESCSASSGFVATGDVVTMPVNSYPGAEEVCDGVDNNCDDQIDERMGRFFMDEDGDGFGRTEIEACMLRDGISV